jgi:ribose-phosphate pyrophosphokinase
MIATIYIPMPGNEVLADSLCQLADGERGALETLEFPDGETYLRLAGYIAGRSIARIFARKSQRENSASALRGADST